MMVFPPLLIGLLASAGVAVAQANPVLVTTSWLADHLNDDHVVVLHVAMSHNGAPNELIPGARVLDYHGVAVEANGLPIEVPAVSELEILLRAAGVSNSDHVIVYGTGSAHVAARVFMTLEYLGHRGMTSVLDGGLETWKREGRPLASTPTTGPAGTFTARVRDDVLVTADQIAPQLEHENVVLVDARPAAEYRGEPSGRGRGGHIPGAYNLYWHDLIVSDEEPRLRDLASVRARFEEAGAEGGDVVISYCAIGMRASYTYLVTRHLGYEARLYDGSWAEWGRRLDLPVERGR